jgi:hypothetical protein
MQSKNPLEVNILIVVIAQEAASSGPRKSWALRRRHSPEGARLSKRA